MNHQLDDLIRGHDLSEAAASDLLIALTDESMSPMIAGALLTALRAKGETAAEMRGFARAMRELALHPVIPAGTPAIDLVGTGGDGSGSLNLSTGSALLAAACGLRVIKHGNRSVSSLSGSADVLEELGYEIPADERSAVLCLEQTGFTFLFAPYFHPAMKAVAPVRQALGIRTVFNMLGPLTNPAEPPFAVIGAFDPQAAALMAETLSGLPIERVFVVHGEPGWDEATPVGPFLLFDVRPGSVEQSERDPADAGVERCSPEDLAGGDAAGNARALRDALTTDAGPHRSALMLGAALALEVSGEVDSLNSGVARAQAAIEDGSAGNLLNRLTEFANVRES